MVTLDDVAQKANVSSMTVSRVINNPSCVKQETRERILSIIKQLNYRPNMVAKSLATKRTNIIAYVVADISDPFYNKVSKGIANTCFARNFTSIICDANSQISVDAHINMLIDRQIDGAIFHDLSINQKQADILIGAGIKLVMLENENDLSGVFAIWGADKTGAAEGIKYLIKKGHKKIGCVHGFLDNASIALSDFPISFQDSFKRKTWIKRTEGYNHALNSAGITYRRYYLGCVEFETSFKMGRDVIKSWQADTDRPSAIYCESDILALGLLSAALENKIEVPESLAILGHDGLDVTQMVYPKITTIIQQRYEMGHLSADYLLNFVNNGQETGDMLLPVTIQKGQTA